MSADSQGLRTTFLDYDARRDPKTQFFCCKCRKDIKGAFRVVHLVDGGAHVLHPADEDKYQPDGGDLGCHPIGPDCARKLGVEWTHEPKDYPDNREPVDAA